jgi:hypothetical protein
MRVVPRSKLPGAAFIGLAHHPHCDRHRHHLLWLGNRPLCLGCTSMAVGTLPGVGLGFALNPVDGELVWWVASMAVLMAPTFVQPFLQRKPFKVFARSCAGAASAAAAVLGAGLWLTQRWLALALLVALFVGLARGLLWLRRRFTPNPCERCPLGRYPTCSWNLERVLADADPLLRQALRSAHVEPPISGELFGPHQNR